MSDQLVYWLGFSRVPGIGPARLQSLLDYYDDIETAWQADLNELRTVGLDRRTIESLAKTRRELNLTAELDQLVKKQISVLTWSSPDYPSLLRNIADPPIVLYVKGQLTVEDDWAVAVVGTRRATNYGLECTRRLTKGLVDSGVTVVSGLAYGIDTEAHTTAVKAKGRTVAVLGCGVDIIYPAQNRKLSEAIVETGALISEYPPGTKPEASHFPRRNRIISGLSLGVLVIEGHIKSGAGITARCALDQGRDVFAVPGSILRKSSAGPNYLIQNGAKLVVEVNDILEELNLNMLPQQAEARTLIPENEAEALLLTHLSAEPLHIDELGQLTNLTASEIASTLTVMELKGMVRQVGSMSYVLAR